MREFEVHYSKHRKDGLATVWVYARKPGFSLKEMKAKKREIIREVALGIFPCWRFAVSIQEGFDLFEHTGFDWYYGEDRLVEFLVEPYAFPVLIAYLQSRWGGNWLLVNTEWTDYFAFDRIKRTH